jgi:oxygen-independent coproporphyrinogen-3 oxidase
MIQPIETRPSDDGLPDRAVAHAVGDAGFGVYIHWPYCASICPYCDFNVRRDRGDDHGLLLRAIATDLRAQAERITRRGAASLFLGGGTPSLLRSDEIALLIQSTHNAFGLATDAEITLECNPEHYANFHEQVAAGVNRLSLGVQALSTRGLLHLGRRHSVREALHAIETAAQAGARVSLDLIYARDGQTTEEWTTELESALNLPVEHVSLYQLTIEPGTPFARAVARGRMAAVGDELSAALYACTQEICERAGFPAYEISNHARGAAAQSRHNLTYWRSGEWVGVGPGAHGRVSLGGARAATRAHRGPKAYIEAVSQTGLGWETAAPLASSEIADETLLMGLRLVEGLDRKRWETMRGAAVPPSRLAALSDLLHADETVLRLTPRGRLLCDRIAADLSMA